MIARAAIVAVTASLITLPAAAQAQLGERAPTTRERVEGAVAQPVYDLNLKRPAIAPVLLAVSENPYSLDGVRRCGDIARGLGELDAALGPDVDSPAGARYRTVDAIVDVGGGMLASLMPFRGVVRAVSGANAAERRRLAAIHAGVTRRSFLKGYARARGCPPVLAVDVTALADEALAL